MRTCTFQHSGSRSVNYRLWVKGVDTLHFFNSRRSVLTYFLIYVHFLVPCYGPSVPHKTLMMKLIGDNNINEGPYNVCVKFITNILLDIHDRTLLEVVWFTFSFNFFVIHHTRTNRHFFILVCVYTCTFPSIIFPNEYPKFLP